MRDPLRDASERTETVKPPAADDEEVGFRSGPEQRHQRLRVQYLNLRCQPRDAGEIDVLAAQSGDGAKRGVEAVGKLPCHLERSYG